MRTPFGGGKTHALVSLYHIATSRDKVQDFPELATLPNPGSVRVAEFIGTDFDLSTGIQIENGKRILTPWGYLAWQIGSAEAYALLETADQQRIAPGNDVLRKIFGDKPILLLMDEVLVYVSDAMGLMVGDSAFGRQVLTFVQKLTEVVRELPKTVLVYSLQASVQEVLWAKDSIAIADNVPQFTIVYLNPDWAEKSRETVLADAMTWLEQRGRDKREYKNALAFVVPHKGEMDKARKGARNALAIASLLEQKAKYKFTAEDIEEFNSKAKDANSVVSAALRRLYDYILLPLPCKDGTSPIRLETIDLQSQINTSQNLQERILDALKNHVFDTIRPNKLLQHSGLDNSDTGYIKAEELVSYFFRFPNLPKILDDSVIHKAIVKAIEEGVFGYAPSIILHPSTTVPTVENPNLISFKRMIPSEELDLSGYFLLPSLVSQLLQSISSENKPEKTELDTTNEENFVNGENSSNFRYEVGTNKIVNVVGEDKNFVEYNSETSSIKRSVLDEIVKGKKPARRYKLAALTNKSQLFQLFEVLQALSDKADEMSIQIEVRAHTQKEFDRTWIQNTIEEPLDEMDIQASTHLE